jgi:hypothetical protein
MLVFIEFKKLIDSDNRLHSDLVAAGKVGR